MSKASGRERWIAIAKTVVLAGWVAAAVIAIEFLIGKILIFTLGRELLMTPVWEAIYGGISYVSAFLIIEFLTPALGNLGEKWLARMENKGFSEIIKTAKTRKKGFWVSRGRFRAANREELGLRGWPTWLDIVFGILGYVATILLAAGATEIFSNFAWFDSEQSQNLIFSPYIEGADRMIAFFVLVLVAPVAEELIFRGWLYGKSRKILGEKLGHWGSIVLSILFVSVAFGALHGQWNVGVTTFVLSAVACVLRELTGTVYAGMLVHMIQNGMAFYLLYVIGAGI